MNPITKLIGAGENTHNQDQSMTEVSFSVTSNAVTMVTNKLFLLILFIIKGFFLIVLDAFFFHQLYHFE